MQRVSLPLLLGFGSAVAGCAMHPLPEDVTRKNTAQIIQAIRCEARAGIAEQLELDLRNSGHSVAIRLADRIAAGDFDFSKLEPDLKRLDPEDKKLSTAYLQSGIALQFRFDITEKNDHTIDASFKDPFTNGFFGLTLQGGDKQQRSNERVVTVAGQFDGLLTGLTYKDCSSAQARVPNWVYPIAGHIGLAEIIKSYVKVARDTKDQLGEAGTFVDTITFTTTISGEGIPTITLTPISEALRLTSIGDTASDSRIDIHELTVSIVLPKTPAARGGGEKPLKAIAPAPSAVPTVGAPTGSSAAAEAERNIYLNRLLRTQKDIQERLDQPQ